MFFPRLRRHAKWMFLFLALVFALGFVGFGVGAGGIGFGDVIRDAAGGGGQPSISDAEERVLDNPKNAKAFRDLSTAHQAAGNTDEAIDALESYVQLRPKDTDALRELAALYLQKASAAQERAQIYQARADYFAPGAIRDTIFADRRQPARPRPDHERGEHELRAADLRGGIGDPDRVGAGRRAVPQDRRSPADGSERPARARAGRTVGERPHDHDRGLQGVPEARAERSDRARGATDSQGVAATRHDRVVHRSKIRQRGVSDRAKTPEAGRFATGSVRTLLRRRTH